MANCVVKLCWCECACLFANNARCVCIDEMCCAVRACVSVFVDSGGAVWLARFMDDSFSGIHCAICFSFLPILLGEVGAVDVVVALGAAAAVG